VEYCRKKLLPLGIDLRECSDASRIPFDVGAFVWFARIIEWEFPGFSVGKCFDRLLELQKTIETEGKITGTTHRFLIVARKPAEDGLNR